LLEITMSSPEAFFDSVAKKDLPIPVVHSDLQRHAMGCYGRPFRHQAVEPPRRASPRHRRKMVAAGGVGQQPALPDRIRACLEKRVVSQFHDILAERASKSPTTMPATAMVKRWQSPTAPLNNAVQSFALERPHRAGR